jgi:hypothetical protein
LPIFVDYWYFACLFSNPTSGSGLPDSKTVYYGSGAYLQESSQLAGEKDAGGGGGVSPSPGFNSAQDSKAAKVATLSQALGYVDQYRYATPVSIPTASLIRYRVLVPVPYCSAESDSCL